MTEEINAVFPVKVSQRTCDNPDCRQTFTVFAAIIPDKEYLADNPDAKGYWLPMDADKMRCPFCGSEKEEEEDPPIVLCKVTQEDIDFLNNVMSYGKEEKRKYKLADEEDK